MISHEELSTKLGNAEVDIQELRISCLRDYPEKAGPFHAYPLKVRTEISSALKILGNRRKFQAVIEFFLHDTEAVQIREADKKFFFIPDFIYRNLLRIYENLRREDASLPDVYDEENHYSEEEAQKINDWFQKAIKCLGIDLEKL